MTQPAILTTNVGSYSPIDWLAALPSEQAVLDATAVVIYTQQRLGIDLPTDGELYPFDVNHPDTNGMIEYFVSRIGGIDTRVGMSDGRAFRAKKEMGFRRKPAGVVRGPLGESDFDLHEAQNPLSRFCLSAACAFADTPCDARPTSQRLPLG
ncbi:MAG: hypothetical protein JJU00_12880 [Opitutales bacterium]|nr:hypothetical protein [Opitutales bacterium]